MTHVEPFFAIRRTRSPVRDWPENGSEEVNCIGCPIGAAIRILFAGMTLLGVIGSLATVTVLQCAPITPSALACPMASPAEAQSSSVADTEPAPVPPFDVIVDV